MFHSSALKLFASFFIVYIASVANAQDLTTLEPDKPIQRELSGGQSHSFQVNLGANQFLNLVVEQRGIDVEVTLLGVDGKPLLTVDSPNGMKGPEPLSFASEMNGNYQIIVKAPDAKAKPGAYEIKVLALRPATTSDQVIAAAYKQYRESQALLSQKKRAEAIALEETVFANLAQHFGKEDATVLSYPHNLVKWYGDLLSKKGGRMADTTGDFAEAETLYLRAMALMEKKFGKDSIEVVNVSNDLGSVYYGKGDFTKSAQMFQQVLEIRRKLFPPESYDIAVSLTNLAALRYKEGNYFDAEQLYQQAKTTWEKLGRKEVFQALNGLAIINLERGDYDQAETLWQKTLEIIESLGPQPSQSKAIILSNLANLYYRKGDNEKAESLQTRAFEMRKQTFSPEHPEVALSYNFLADIYYRKGDLAKAQEFYRQALDLLKKKVGEENPNVAYSLNRLARIAQSNNDYPKAESLFQDTLALRTKLVGTKHPEVAETLSELALLYRNTNDSPKAFAYQSQVNEINEANLKQNLLAGSERQKLRYIALFSDAVNATLSLHAQAMPENKEAAKLAMEAILRSKGRGLDAMSDSIATFRRHSDAEQQKLLDRLASARSQLANLTFRGLSGDKPETYLAQIKQHEKEIDQLEAELSQRSAEFATETQSINLQAIQTALPAQASLLEFATYQPYQPTSKTFASLHYLAYVLNADGTIRWKDLGEANQIDQAIENLRFALRDPKRDDAASLARQVDEKVMRPVRALLGESKHLLISPDGMLNLLPFAALVDEQKRYLIERYTISYLTSGRDLLRLQVARTPKGAPLIVADPDFDLNAKSQAIAMAPAKTSGRRATLRGFKSGSESFNEWNADRLSETSKEAEEIKTLWPQAIVLARAKATKSALQQIAAPSILHIATHGFFLEDAAPAANNTRKAGARGSEADVIESSPLKDPLLRSGLLFAGFNQHRSDADNGVLTAKEAAGLDLWGTRLVVLSACDTGVGEVKNGDGVYGLRRALVLAGAETQVMSLWPVDEIASREWMTTYYTGLKQGLGRGESLRQVQLKMLQKKNRQHPFYWAGFIQSGEWANLEGKR
ncbi:MAG: CHAT domain-containing protein [Acidobacteria bacterium]|nr:CHAT domain-containing protein [Acidobacteriota bacterium]